MPPLKELSDIQVSNLVDCTVYKNKFLVLFLWCMFIQCCVLQVLASASGSFEMSGSQICVWDLQSLVCKKVLSHHEYDIVCLACLYYIVCCRCWLLPVVALRCLAVRSVCGTYRASSARRFSAIMSLTLSVWHTPEMTSSSSLLVSRRQMSTDNISITKHYWGNYVLLANLRFILKILIPFLQHKFRSEGFI